MLSRGMLLPKRLRRQRVAPMHRRCHIFRGARSLGPKRQHGWNTEMVLIFLVLVGLRNWAVVRAERFGTLKKKLLKYIIKTWSIETKHP
jgi:hypothetical protein